jgi:hypothetical protein
MWTQFKDEYNMGVLKYFVSFTTSFLETGFNTMCGSTKSYRYADFTHFTVYCD